MKKKITAVALVVALLAVGIIGGTLAYFTDTKDVTNTFTAGNVAITLDEAKIATDNDGKITVVKDNDENVVRTTEDQSYKLYPGMEVTKDPTITVAPGSEKAWVAAKIAVKGDLMDLIGLEKWGNIDITKIVSGGICNASTQKTNWNSLSMVYENTDAVVYQDYSKNTENEWVIYVFVKAAKVAGDKVVLFDKVTVPTDWDNAEMTKLNNTTVEVKAFAAQEYGFADCFTAMTKAFPTEFNFAG